ncbi:TetR family transcriptional regulator [Spongisporangium articulatum]|uniref:TetR family transcriptional regulator n=1 Tax=Spongisporangium articulatum TaxID=3362603 RepID=A0ABW8AIR5_9ACTN
MTSSPREELTATPQGPGLRERKKARTRATIRSEAIRLFTEQGFAATTVEQIAAAADVSPSTFFRYFPTKEATVITDEFDPRVFETFMAQPPDVHPVTAFRLAVRDTLGAANAADREQEHKRQALYRTEPALRSALMEQMASGVDELAGMIALRKGGDPEDPVTRTQAGAIIGVALSVTRHAHTHPQMDMNELGTRMDEALQMLESMPF